MVKGEDTETWASQAQWQESVCQCRGHRFDPWSGNIPCAMEQLSPRATTTESML